MRIARGVERWNSKRPPAIVGDWAPGTQSRRAAEVGKVESKSQSVSFQTLGFGISLRLCVPSVVKRCHVEREAKRETRRGARRAGRLERVWRLLHRIARVAAQLLL